MESEQGLSTRAGDFELGIWHPLALPAEKQNREGFKMLHGFPDFYPTNVPLTQRAQAIEAVRAFLSEAEDIVGNLPEGESDFSTVSAPLHAILSLNASGGRRIAAEIAQAALHHGLVFYDPQADILSTPVLRIPGETGAAESDTKTISNSEEASIINVGPWTVRAFVSTTRAQYQRITDSGSDRCGCDNCSNFARVRDQVFPAEILTVFDSLGIDFRKESEVHYYGRTPAGLHTYRGWFYLVGLIETGPESWHCPPKGKPEKRFHQVGPHFEIGLKRKSEFGFAEWETVLIEAGFTNGQTVEIDFYADVPWISEAPEPAVNV